MATDKTLYSCSHQTFYIVAQKGFISCLEQLETFAAYKASYTSQYVQQHLNSIKEAETMKTVSDLNQYIARAKFALENSIALCRLNWMKLKGYINTLATADQRYFAYIEAGGDFYAKSAKTWTPMKELLLKSTAYLKKNEGALLLNNNMPLAFATTYINDNKNCNALKDQYEKLRSSKGVSVQEKIKAGNAIYKALIDLFTDGQCLFPDQPALKKQFIFRQVLRMVEGGRLG